MLFQMALKIYYMHCQSIWDMVLRLPQIFGLINYLEFTVYKSQKQTAVTLEVAPRDLVQWGFTQNNLLYSSGPLKSHFITDSYG